MLLHEAWQWLGPEAAAEPHVWQWLAAAKAAPLGPAKPFDIDQIHMH